MVTLSNPPGVWAAVVDYAALLWLGFSVVFVTLLASLFGVPFRDIMLYLGYEMTYALLPGLICYLLAVSAPRNLLAIILCGWVIGVLLETWGYVFLLAIGYANVFPFYPLLVIGGALWQRRTLRLRLVASSQTLSPLYSWKSALGLCLAAFFVLFPAFLYHFRPPIDQHFTWVAAYANSVGNGWPLEEPLLTGVPLHYHYLPNLHIAAASAVTGIPSLLIAARLFPIVHLWLTLALLFTFARIRFGSWAIGIFAGVQILSTYGYTPMSWHLFHHASASILVLLPSAVLAYEVLLVIWHEIVDCLSRWQFDQKHFLFVAALLLLCSGVRAQLLPIVMAGVCVLGVYSFFSQRSLLLGTIAVLACACLGMLFGLWFFYGLGTTTNATGVLAIHPFNPTVALIAGPFGKTSTFYQSVEQATGSGNMAAVCVIVVALVGRLGFLLPGVIAYWVWFRREAEKLTVALLVGAYLAGIGAISLLHSLFQEQWNFQLYGDLAIALVGATGLVRACAMQTRRVFSLLLLGVPSLVLSAYEFFPPFVHDVRQLGSSMDYPTYSDDPTFSQLIDWFQRECPSHAVVVTGGQLSGFDDRVLPALIPGLQVFANRKQLSIYLARVSPNPALVRRHEILSRPWSSATYQSLRDEVPRDRPLFLLWLNQPPPPAAANLQPLFTVGRYSVYRIGDAHSPGNIKRGGASR
jgi:hypothetical protein